MPPKLVFISAGEPSGDLHAANLIRALRHLDPDTQCFGFGGPHMEAAGARVLFPLASHAIMGLSGIARALPTMIRILNRAIAEMRLCQPVAAVLIDYPGFHWHLARRTKAIGVPVISFVPPQIWSWASHRVKKVRANFDRVLCSLPFEEAWFRERGVPADYIGHPYFDETNRQIPDAAFLADQRRQDRPIVAVLPGSRGGEIDRNLEMQIRALRQIQGTRPDTRILFACFKESHRQRVIAALADAGLSAEAFVGRTSEIIALGDACIAVSGSVGLELIHHGTPSTIIYRVNPVYRALARRVLNVPYISIVNLLAGRELFPEFLTSKDVSGEVSTVVLNWLADPAAAARVRADLAGLRSQIGRPGACGRAADVVLEIARQRAAA